MTEAVLMAAPRNTSLEVKQRCKSIFFFCSKILNSVVVTVVLLSRNMEFYHTIIRSLISIVSATSQSLRVSLRPSITSIIVIFSFEISLLIQKKKLVKRIKEMITKKN